MKFRLESFEPKDSQRESSEAKRLRDLEQLRAETDERFRVIDPGPSKPARSSLADDSSILFDDPFSSPVSFSKRSGIDNDFYDEVDKMSPEEFEQYREGIRTRLENYCREQAESETGRPSLTDDLSVLFDDPIPYPPHKQEDDSISEITNMSEEEFRKWHKQVIDSFPEEFKERHKL